MDLQEAISRVLNIGASITDPADKAALTSIICKASAYEESKPYFITQEQLDRIEKRQDEMNGKVEDTNSLIRAHVLPRPADYAVSTDDLSKILERLEIKRGKRTIERWEQYITTNGEKGAQPPDGYTLQTRLTLESASAWAADFANKEKSKLNTKISLERLTGGRN